jgi:excisionase family DNA binding protein
MPTATYDFITVDEVAQALRVSPNTVRTWLSEGKLRGFKVSHKVWRIQRADFEQFVQAGIREPSHISVGNHTDAAGPAALAIPNTRTAILQRLQAMRAEGLSQQAMADRFNKEQIPTLSGRGRWQAGTIGKLLQGAG